MLKMLVALNLTLASMGGVTYGEAPSAERLPPETKGQATRTVEKIPSKRKAENRKKSSERGKSGNGTKSGTSYVSYGTKTDPVGEKQLPESVRSGKKPNQSVQGSDQNTQPKSTAPNGGNSLPSSDKHNDSTLVFLGTFTITAYTAGYESTQKKKGEPGYGITATGTTVKEGRTIAANWGVLPPGTVVKIEGLEGSYTVEDRGGGVKGKHIDIYIADLNKALDWGRQKRKVSVVTWGKPK
ncbi:3D domain-containing protein [Cytobacillus praedii]|uniref:3D domain-containing protein n=1 Tax=Cytobacillus praedii TaxID=1742358 RepID=UPI002E20BA9E|nr:3D domain-containing protein [Cytobacillus praedii]